MNSIAMILSRVFLISAAAMAIAACAPASLGSPPASERTRNCVAGETLVCRDRYPSRLEKEGEQDDQFCTCELLDRGLR
ncbi:MAG: hypothetical protein HC812_14890 [Leptolyngbya sp. RL_3_1]|nr:hypothetical protein [Leptolyngbya sp. RL_3_1]